jgi:tripartite-type tricarboxylate transporter receptor subunit TctC
MTALVASAFLPAATQAYLTRAITLVVSFEPGGSTDLSTGACAPPVVRRTSSGTGSLRSRNAGVGWCGTPT